MSETIQVKDWREVDKLFLSRVFGFPARKIFTPDWAEGDTSILYYIPSGKPRRTHMIDAEPVPYYSSLLDAAMKGIEKIEGHWLRLTSPFNPGDWWYAGFSRHNMAGWDGRPDKYARSDTPARAVVLACLKAKGIGIEFAALDAAGEKKT